MSEPRQSGTGAQASEAEARKPGASVQAAPAGEFFRSRWVERPAHVKELEPTALPAGFRAAGVAAGIKSGGRISQDDSAIAGSDPSTPTPGPSAPLDVGLLVADPDATVSAARFTTNALVAAPVSVSREADRQRLRVIAVNSGNANVSDGRRGLETALASQALVAELAGVEPERVAVASTGVIGRNLPRERLLAGLRAAAQGLGPDAGAFAEAIVTTDRWPKRACLEVALSGGSVRLAGQAKGAGMIAPNMATMLCFVETDAALPAETLDLLTGVTVKRSFDRICVDGQLSTNDSVFVLANGASGVSVEPESDDEVALGEAMDALLRQLALEVVADGEGASHVGRVIVRGAAELVEPVARAVADSPLVKTALLGADPNFGRILQAAGQALAGRAPFAVDLFIEGRQVASGGEALDLTAEEFADLQRAVDVPEVELELTVPGEGGETEVFFSDLTHDYVSLNAEYST